MTVPCMRQRACHQLSIVWTHPPVAARLAAQVHALGMDSHVRVLERVPDGDLRLL